eukprot:jgi/Galph1/659/GphlegSOOS_G5310.1
MSHRVIVHVDLDCFYAQVESVRLGLDSKVPLCVQQWDGVIAVNYAAREQGVTRHDRVEKVKEKCPSCVLVHVETVGLPEENAISESSKLLEGSNNIAKKRSDQKVSLDCYREASRKVFQVLSSFDSVVEKASVDEAYLDLTSTIQRLLDEVDDAADIEEVFRKLKFSTQEAECYSETNFQPFGGHSHADIPFHLLVGCALSAKIRTAIYQQCKYTCSAGIAENKLLAKLGSSLNKPNQQTLIAPSSVPSLLESLPLKRIRNLGGKLGSYIEENTNLKTVKDAQRLSLEEWNALLGKQTAEWIYNIVRGIDDSPVTPREKTKSILAAKSFQAESSWDGIKKWISILSYELLERLTKDELLNHRKACNLVIHCTCSGFHSFSKSIPFPPGKQSIETIINKTKKTLETSQNFRFPCYRMSLSVTRFQEFLPNEISVLELLKSHSSNSECNLSTSKEQFTSETDSFPEITDKAEEQGAVDDSDYAVAYQLQQAELAKSGLKHVSSLQPERATKKVKSSSHMYTLDHYFRNGNGHR